MAFREKAGHLDRDWSMRLIPMSKVSTEDADIISAMVKLAEGIDESATEVVGYGRVR